MSLRCCVPMSLSCVGLILRPFAHWGAYIGGASTTAPRTSWWNPCCLPALAARGLGDLSIPCRVLIRCRSFVKASSHRAKLDSVCLGFVKALGFLVQTQRHVAGGVSTSFGQYHQHCVAAFSSSDSMCSCTCAQLRFAYLIQLLFTAYFPKQSGGHHCIRMRTAVSHSAV